jgi:hypothetical protein
MGVDNSSYKYIFLSLFCLLIIHTSGYLQTDIYPDTLEQCGKCLVPIATAISYQSCVYVPSEGLAYFIQCTEGDNTTYTKFTAIGSNTCTLPFTTSLLSINNTCTYTNNPTLNIVTSGFFNTIQTCQPGAPKQDINAGAPTLSITEYTNPSCNPGSQDSPMIVSTTTSKLNVCQNTGGSPNIPGSGSSFLIQCNSATAYISYFNGYGCFSAKLNSTTTLFQLGCSTKGSSSIAASCSGTSPQQSNDFWAMIIQSTYFAYAVSIGSGLIVGGFFICLCICYCRRRNRNKRHRRSFSSPTQYSTSVQSNGVIVDGIGTPLRSDVLPGLGNNQGSPSQGGQSKQNVRTPLLSQSNEERGGFGNDDDDSEA